LICEFEAPSNKFLDGSQRGKAVKLKVFEASRAKSQLAWLLILLLLTFSVSALSGGARTRIEPCKITALKAMLFYDNKGTFSGDVAEVEGEIPGVPSILRNTPIEGASREGASTSVLVTAEVIGDQESPPARKLEFTARYRPLGGSAREIVVRRIAPIYIREGGKYIAGFWLYDTGCHPVKLKVRVIGQREASTMKRMIRFGCGE
jgi:hypothetical protein